MVEPSNELQLVFEKAIDVAKKLKHDYLTVEHLLFAMLCDEGFFKCVSGYGASAETLKKNLEDYLKTELNEIVSNHAVVKPKKTQAVERVLNRAFTQVLFNGRQKIESSDVFIAIMSEKRSFANYFMQQVDIDKDKFAEYLNSELTEEHEEEPREMYGDKALKSYTTDLNHLVRKNKIDPVIGRENELENIALTLGRRQKSNIILVGDPGVGKTAIAEGLAYNIVNGAIPDFLKGYTVYNLDVS